MKAAILSTTIVQNMSDIDLVYWGFAGGLNAVPPIEPSIQNAILAGVLQATITPGYNFPDVYRRVDTHGHNLIGQAQSIQGFGALDQVGSAASPLNPGLNGLADNGGFGPTHLPSLSSLAVDMGRTASTVDQRHGRRPENMSAAMAPGANEADVGAVELQNSDF